MKLWVASLALLSSVAAVLFLRRRIKLLNLHRVTKHLYAEWSLLTPTQKQLTLQSLITLPQLNHLKPAQFNQLSTDELEKIYDKIMTALKQELSSTSYYDAHDLKASMDHLFVCIKSEYRLRLRDSRQASGN